MLDDLTAIAARVGALETPNDLIQLLRDGGRRITPVELQALGHAGFSKDAELQGSLLNPGDGAPLWLLRGDRKRDVALVSRALRRHARSAPTGCSAAFVVDAAGTAIHVALATDDAPEHCASTARNIDARALDAWAAFVSTRHSAVACLRAFRLLRKRAVGAAFFRDVRASVQQISGGWLQGPTDPLQRHALSMTFLCRMMFLYFVQQKQWLDGDAGFMAALVLDPRAERIYGQRLRPLFFDVLNRPVDGRPEAWAARRIPYLNGGLFTESPLEREWPGLSLPDEVLRELVESTLERYRFVEAEDEARVGVDPEMLGAVFESLMHPAQRGDTGTFYTPVRLVEECVTDALSESLGARVGDDIAAVLMSDQSLEPAELPAVRAALDDIRVLDPAMGSGAFLLGALRKLTALRRVAFGEDEATATRAVIQSSLYGVDTSASAVTIAELRIWLALAAVLPDGGDVEPLPNLGHRFRRGNALIGVSHWSAFDGARPAPGAHERLADLAEAFGAAHGREKARLAEELRAAELAVAVSLLEAAARVKEAEVRGLEARKLPDLMGYCSRLSVAESRRLRAAEAAAQHLRERICAAESGAWTPAFDFAVQFGDVVARGGFDAIVGNPPWVRLARLPADERRRLRERYAWMRDAGAGKPFGSQPDLAVAFVERSLGLLRDGGAFALVVPAKLFTAGYASAMRAGLLRDAQVRRLRDLSDSAVAHFAADVFPAVIVARRQALAPSMPMVRLDDGAGRSGVTTPSRLGAELDPRSEWPLLDAGAIDVLRRLEQSAERLSGAFATRMGVKTGANACFLDADVEGEATVGVVRGSDVRPMCAEASGTILYAHDRHDGAVWSESRLSSAERAWFVKHAERLGRRADAGEGDPAWTVFRSAPENLGHRVVWRDIGIRLDAAYVPPVADGGPVALNTTYCVAVRDARAGVRLAAWLCSTPVRFCAASRAERALSGYRRFMLRNVARVPMVRAVLEGDPVLDALSARLQLDPEDAAGWMALDRWVAGALGLSRGDLAVIRGEAVRLSLQSCELSAVVEALGR